MVARRLAPTMLAVVFALGVTACGADDGGSDAPPGVQGTEGEDQLTGTEGDDVLDGLGGSDTIEGLGGDDEISGGEGEDFLYGGEGDDTFLESEDDAVDVHECGPGEDFVAEPDTRDELLPDCEEAAWRAVPISEEPYENRISVTPELAGGGAKFTGTCPDGCSGLIELRTPRDRLELGKGRFDLAPGERGVIRASLTRDGRELLRRGGYVRVVLRVGENHSGFTTFLSQQG